MFFSSALFVFNKDNLTFVTDLGLDEGVGGGLVVVLILVLLQLAPHWPHRLLPGALVVYLVVVDLPGERGWGT